MDSLARPDFTVKEGNRLSALHCKICGEQIAGIVERIKGDPKVGRYGERVITKVERFTNFPNFTELKMAMADGSAHITTGCDKCLNHELSKDQLRDLFLADIEEQRAELGDQWAMANQGRVPLTIIGIKVGGGIV